ncbi:MAG TPA: alpha/beta hydrolase [Ktedonobacterales bacterium]|nr:alpha/beta hydrolase [Ktedonobacterales bacterium]
MQIALIVLAVIVGLAIITFGALEALAYRTALRLITPNRKLLERTPADLGLADAIEEVGIPGPHGMLSAWYLPARNGCTIICCHGIHDNKGQWLEQMARLYRRGGYGALLFDFAGHGQSDGRFVTYGVNEQDDVQAVIAYLRERGDVYMDGLAIMGCSLGAITSVLSAAVYPELRAVVIESGFADLLHDIAGVFSRYTGLPAFPLANMTVFWGERMAHVKLSQIRPERVIGQIAPRPILIISDLKDRLADEPHDGERLYAAAGEPKQLWQVPDAEHVAAYQTHPDEWIERVGDFLDEQLAARSANLASIETQALAKE